MTRAAGNGRLDLEAAAKAAAAEAKAAPFPFTYKGTDYEVPPSTEWPVDAIDRLARGELGPALAALLGPETYDALKADGLMMGELNALFEQIGEDAGLDGLPNSSLPLPPGLTRT